MRSLILTTALLASPAFGEDYPKLGPDATSLTADSAYLRAALAPDFWAYESFVKPQFTTSACGIASVTAAVNGLAGLPENGEDTVPTQEVLLETMGNARWVELTAEGGDGVTFQDLIDMATEASAAAGLDVSISNFHPDGVSDENLATLKDWLATNEASADDVLMLYFNQGVVTGDWDGPHVSLIGAYDAANDKVLILEVDQEWYVPYWTSTSVLLDAMVKPTSAEHGPLEGQTGGFVRIAKN